MNVETINTFFEGIISLAVIIGAGWVLSTHPDSIAAVGVASGAAMSVITFWFGQRGVAKAINGNINAMSEIAGQIKSVPGPTGPPGEQGPVGPTGVG